MNYRNLIFAALYFVGFFSSKNWFWFIDLTLKIWKKFKSWNNIILMLHGIKLMGITDLSWNHLFRFSPPPSPPSILTPNQTWPVEQTITHFLTLTCSNVTPALQTIYNDEIGQICSRDPSNRSSKQTHPVRQSLFLSHSNGMSPHDLKTTIKWL